LSILADLRQYAHLHPLILSATEVEPFSNKFRIVERPFRLFPIRISYIAQRNCFNNKIDYQISGIPFTTGTMRYAINCVDDRKTSIDWYAEISSSLPIETWLVNKMLSAQNILMARLSRAQTDVEKRDITM